MRRARRKPPVVFVDVDGVLNSTAWFLRACGDATGESISPHRPDLRLDPACITRLARIERALDATFVLSSNWRRSMTHHQFAHLCFLVTGYRPTFIGQTYVYGEVLPDVRRREISAYARYLACANNFVVLDDMELRMSEQVWVNPDHGLTNDHVLDVIARFR